MKWNQKVPFSKDFSQLFAYVANWEEEKVEWVDNLEFYAELVYDNWHKGRSAANMTFIVTPDEKYENFNSTKAFKATMFLKDFHDVMNESGFDGKTIISHGPWRFCKRGENYGIRRSWRQNENSKKKVRQAKQVSPPIEEDQSECNLIIIDESKEQGFTIREIGNGQMVKDKGGNVYMTTVLPNANHMLIEMRTGEAFDPGDMVLYPCQAVLTIK